MGKWSFMDLFESGEGQTDFEEIYLSPYEVEPSERNFYSQENIEELADSERIKNSIRIGDQIKWYVLTGAAETQNHYPTSEKVLTVTRKSRYLFEAIDSAGLTHSIRYAELAAARRAGR